MEKRALPSAPGSREEFGAEETKGCKMIDLAVVLAIFILILAVMVALRLKFGSRFEIRNTDILIALIPAALWLVFAGKIKSLEFGGFKIEAAFAQAARQSVKHQVTPVKLPVERVRVDLKRGVEEIPKLIRHRTEALIFTLGHGSYYGPAIEEYLKRLTASPFLKYVVIQRADGTFFGLLDALELNAFFRVHTDGLDASKFADWLNRSATTPLSDLPGFIALEHAVTEKTQKQSALEAMDRLDRDFLPVVDTTKRFVGVVKRSRLTASLIVDVANKIE